MSAHAARAVWALVLIAACGDKKAQPPRGGDGEKQPAAAVTPAGAAGSIATGTAPCTLGALWDECVVIKRLEQQGLVPRLDTASHVTVDGFSVPGRSVKLGRGEIVFFLYPDSARRVRDTAALDTLTAAPRGSRGSWSQPPTLVVSRNVAVVLLSRETNVRIRVTDAFTAGLPALPAP